MLDFQTILRKQGSPSSVGMISYQGLRWQFYTKENVLWLLREGVVKSKVRNRRTMGGTAEGQVRDNSGLPTVKAVEMK